MSKLDNRPDIPTGPIVSLVYRVLLNQREELISFLQEALPFYERPGGIRIGLYESVDEPGFFQELVAYDTESSYEADQHRVEEDPEMKKLLEKWHSFIDGPLEGVRSVSASDLERVLRLSVLFDL